MYRLLKGLDWKSNFYIKCKRACLVLLIVQLVNCSSLEPVDLGDEGRTDNGIFRHDKPYDSSSSVQYSEGDIKRNGERFRETPDHRDKYDRFKRSVTSLNFHPKNSSQEASGLKQMRIFKYVTDAEPQKESRHDSVFNSVKNNDTSQSTSTRQIGGAKINHQKASKEKVIKGNLEQVKTKSSAQPKKPIGIFKPTLAFRKDKQASLKYKKDEEKKEKNDEVKESASKGSTDPNSSSVTRSLIHNLFDAVVHLNQEEGQKELERVNHERDVIDSNTVGSGSGAIDDEEIKTSPNPPSTTPPTLERNSTRVEEKSSPSLNKIKISNKDKLVVKVVKKRKIEKQKLTEEQLNQDGSERWRRSPFRFTPGQEQLARAAMFRRNTAIMMTPRIRQLTNPSLTKKIKVMPRIITTGAGGPIARTIPMKAIPLKPIPVMPFISRPQPKLHFMPSATGPLGPGPVGPPLAAIKVMPLKTIDNRNIFLSPQPLVSHTSTGIKLHQPKDLTADASKTIFNFKPLPDDLILNQAASSYYSPTYKRFKNHFDNEIANIMENGKEMEETANHWEESRNPPRHNRDRHHHRDHHRRTPAPARPRSSARHRHHAHPPQPRHHHRFDRRRHHHPGPHRSGSQHPHHRPPLIRGKKLSTNPKYAYPKNAQNIQDILTYFDKEVPIPHSRRQEHSSRGPSEKHHGHGSSIPSKRQHHSHSSRDSAPIRDEPPGPQHQKLTDLSMEFRDVHASLLKDIKEFARRPNMFSSSSTDHHTTHTQSPLTNQKQESMEGSAFFDPIDEIFNPKPKPVREMIKYKQPTNQGHIKPDLYSLENIRERIALKRGKLGGRQKDETRDLHSYSMEPPHTEPDEDFFDNHRHKSRHNHNHDRHNSDSHDRHNSHNHDRHNSHDMYSAEHTKLFNSKEDYEMPSSYTKKNRNNDHSAAEDHFQSHAGHSHRDSGMGHPYEFTSSEFPSKHFINSGARKPVVLKRPGESYKKDKKKSEEDYIWSFPTKPPATVNLDSPLVLKSPQAKPTVLKAFNPYEAFNNAAAAAMAAHSQQNKPLSVEDEDIVEIHTGGPAGLTTIAGAAQQEKLKKMYMDVLQQKLQLEAALLQPQLQLPGLHSSASVFPQHNPIANLPRVGLPAYAPSTVTLSPLTGLSGLGLPRKKKPMRMKIHIYPNGNDGIEQGIEAANLLAAGGFGASGFSASNPHSSVVAPPTAPAKEITSESAISHHNHHHNHPHPIPSGQSGLSNYHNINQQYQQHHPMPTGQSGHPGMPSGLNNHHGIPSGLSGMNNHHGIPSGLSGMNNHHGMPTGPNPTSPSGYGGTGSTGATAPAPIPQTVGGAVKNKNVVLHLHVHRRNDPLEVEAEGTSPEGVTAKPPPHLTYQQIYSDFKSSSEREPHTNLANHRMSGEDEGSHVSTAHEPHNHQGDEEEAERDKSLSMEAPIHDEKIDDVFHSIMKLRTRPDADSDGDKRKKRNRN